MMDGPLSDGEIEELERLAQEGGTLGIIADRWLKIEEAGPYA